MNYTKVLKLTAIAAVILTGCKEKEVTPTPTKPVENNVANPNKEVNSWIYDEMKTYYLWTDQLAAKASTNDKLAPDAYFESLLYKPGEVDRFSWIQESSDELKASLAGKNTVLGVRHATFYADPTGVDKSKLVYNIAYVLKGSPAEKAGLKRGDIIMKVNGSPITIDNYTTLLSPENLNLTLGKYNTTSNTFEETGKQVNVVKAEVQTIPVQTDTVINVGSKKIGYMHYVQFIPGKANADNTMTSEFDDQVRTVFGRFKQAGINELVLDLRYNGGGYISSAVVLSSLIVKGLAPNVEMYRDEWNKEVTDYYVNKYGANFFKKYFRVEPNNLGTLNRVYVLTSKSSASASELVINSLLPYMDVVIIGDNTYGKNVGSITIDDDKKRWKWGMQPIVLRTVNALGKSDYGTKEGFKPTVKVTDNKLPFMPLGSASETLMSAAISHMTGQAVTAKVRIGNQVIEKRSMRQATPTQFSDTPSKELTDMFTELPR